VGGERHGNLRYEEDSNSIDMSISNYLPRVRPESEVDDAPDLEQVGSSDDAVLSGKVPSGGQVAEP